MVQPVNEGQVPRPTRERSRVSAEHRYPVYDLNEAIEVARAIRDQAGGACTREHLAAFLSYRSTNNGAFLSRLASARLFGLVETSGRELVPTRLADTILTPEWPDEAVEARAEAFMTVPLYRVIYGRYEGAALPPEVGLRNALHSTYGIPENRTAIAYRVLMDSAAQAGFFAARGGGRTNLIKPLIRADKTPSQLVDLGQKEEENRGQSLGAPTSGAPASDAEQVRLEYIRKLISLIGSDTVADQEGLMQRIEALLSGNLASGAT